MEEEFQDNTNPEDFDLEQFNQDNSTPAEPEQNAGADVFAPIEGPTEEELAAAMESDIAEQPQEQATEEEPQEETVVNPLLEADDLFDERDEIINQVAEDLDDADTADEVMEVLYGLHKGQLRAALKKRAQLERKEKEDKEKLSKLEQKMADKQTEVESQESEQSSESVEEQEDVKPFEPFTFEPNKKTEPEIAEAPEPQPQATSEELFGDFLSGENGFGGISLDMLSGENKTDTEDALKDNGNPFEDATKYESGGYIDKNEYYEAKEASKENIKKGAYLTENDGLFDPDNIEDDQVIVGKESASKKSSEASPFGGMTEETPADEDEKQPKYKVKKEKQKQFVDSGDTSGKGVAWMAYILFFIPLIFAGKKSYVRHHANQGLVINFVDVIIAALIGAKFLPMDFISQNEELFQILYAVGLFIALISIFTRLAMAVLSLFGKRFRLPILGKLNIIKSE
ncbi:MAG: hypothetical protein IK070_01350 [Clostridia bacterium]|nr:hypothetical protein [Clostridia bacterium]